MTEIDPIPNREPLANTYLHIFFGLGVNHYVVGQTISEIYAGSGTYRLFPPATYPDPAYAFSTLDLYIEDAATGQRFVGVYSLEPISGIITLLAGGFIVTGTATGFGTSNFIQDTTKDFVALGVEIGDSVTVRPGGPNEEITTVLELDSTAPDQLRIVPVTNVVAVGNTYRINTGPVSEYPATIKVSYRYYGAMVSIRSKDHNASWPSGEDENPDIYNQNVFTLQDKFPLVYKFSLYGAQMDLIKAFMRDPVRTNKFVLILDDNICDLTYNSNTPGLFRPGVAYEGPLFCDEIDLVLRGGKPWIPFTLQVHKYGDYYWHRSITPTDRWWPDETGGAWGWTYWDTYTLTPPVGYAWPPTWWWSGPGYVESNSFTYTYDDMSSDCGTYLGVANVAIAVQIDSLGAPDTFQWTYDIGGGPILGGAFVPITGAWQNLTAAGFTVRVRFTNTTGHFLLPGAQWWSFIAYAIPPSPSTCSGVTFNGENVSYDCANYWGKDDRIYRMDFIVSGGAGVGQYNWSYSDDYGGSWIAGAGSPITVGAPPQHLSFGAYVTFGGLVYYAGSRFEFTAATYQPVGIRPVAQPPGGYIIWKSNIPLP